MTTDLSSRPALTTLSDDEEDFREVIRNFAEEVIRPKVEEMDRNAKMDPEVIEALFENGLMGIEIPEEYEGQGGTFFMAALAVEELARVDPSVAVMQDVQNTLVNNIFRKWGNDDQKTRFYPRLATKDLAAYALTESGSGSDAFALSCRALEDGDDYLLTGQKLWITNAAEAKLFVVFANVDPEAGHKGITAFIVERDQEGFTVGKKEDKLGIRASSTCELILDNVRVSKKDILGPVGKGYKVAIETLNEGRIGIAAQMVGIAQGALDHTIAYVKDREQFGRAIGKFQGVQFQIARMAVGVETARLLVYNAARMHDAGQDFLTQAAMAKLASSEIAEQVTSMAVNLFGGNGYTKEYPVEKLWRDSKIGQIYEGTSNMQLQTIAKQIMG
jgi:alkylation response protein AidB-like acyl-CoA dehydrogenase